MTVLHASIPIAPDPVITTEELKRRPSRSPNYEAENRALICLAQQMTSSPENILQRLAETALDLCHAHSAGLSILEEEDGRRIFRWRAAAGQWACNLNGTMPRELSPCGTVLDRNKTLLMSRPERCYPPLVGVEPVIHELLLIPFDAAGETVGTIWVMSHDPSLCFDAEDLRVMTSLGKFASSAYQVLVSFNALRMQVTRRKQAEESLRTTQGEFGITRGLLAAIVESSADAIISKDMNGIITSWNQAAEHLFGYTAEEAIGQSITMLVPQDRPAEEDGILASIRRGEKVEHFETVRVRKNGRPVHVSLTISPIWDSMGRVVGASKIARDITDRKRAEQAVVQAQDEERRRIARELHDGAGQTLTALSLNLALLSRQTKKTAPQLADSAEQTEKLVQELNQEIRTMSYLLHPPLLDDCGLPEALQNYVDGLKQRSGLKITLEIPEDFERLSGEMELAIFRVVQESLINVHRHSGSKTAAIRVARKQRKVWVEVEDAGSGISPEKLKQIQSRASGVGIRGMRERVRHLEGDLKIQSDGSGTKVSATFPLHP